MSLPGVLYLSSRVILGFSKKSVPYKRFRGIDGKEYKVACKRKNYNKDVYAVIKKEGGVKGTLTGIIGDVGSYKAEYQYLLYRNTCKWSNKKIIGFYEDDLTPDRLDFREVDTFSIDPSGCKDIDDCLSFQDNGKCVSVMIHIADPSSFIPEGSHLDIIARQRVETLYLKQKQYNMLPDQFSFDKCSLLEGQERRACTVIVIFRGVEIETVEFKKTTIINDKAFTYQEAQYDERIKGMYDFGQTLYEQVFERDDFLNHGAYDSHKMVETYMLLANKVVAEHLVNNSPTPLLRVHDGPKEPLVSGTTKAVRKMNIYRMNRAVYQIGTYNTDHSALNMQYYTHFTSPIRRYVDILVHRLLFNENVEVGDIDRINMQQKMIKRCNRESETLELIYSLYNNYNSVVETRGTLIAIEEDQLQIYIEEFDIDVDYNIPPKSILPGYSLLDEIEVRLVVSMKESNFRRKLMVELI